MRKICQYKFKYIEQIKFPKKSSKKKEKFSKKIFAKKQFVKRVLRLIKQRKSKKKKSIFFELIQLSTKRNKIREQNVAKNTTDSNAQITRHGSHKSKE